jgi:DNA-directed RNA polymerase subunit RPC12/RpoP
LVTAGPRDGRVFVLSEPGVYLFGRAADLPGCLGDDDYVSNEHFEIELQSHHALLRDRGSRNGTLLNGRPLAPTRFVAGPDGQEEIEPGSEGNAVPLRNGAEIQAGRTRLKVEVEVVPFCSECGAEIPATEAQKRRWIGGDYVCAGCLDKVLEKDRDVEALAEAHEASTQEVSGATVPATYCTRCGRDVSAEAHAKGRHRYGGYVCEACQFEEKERRRVAAAERHPVQRSPKLGRQQAPPPPEVRPTACQLGMVEAPRTSVLGVELPDPLPIEWEERAPERTVEEEAAAQAGIASPYELALDDGHSRETLPAMAAGPATTPPAPLPAALGDYEVVREAGLTDLGRRVVARRRTDQQRVALELIHVGSRPDDALVRFVRGMAPYLRVRHRRLVGLLDADGEGEWLLLASEQVEGTTAEELVPTGATPPGEAVAGEVALQVLSGLEHLHHQGLTHGAMTPRDVLVRLERDVVDARAARAGLRRVLAETFFANDPWAAYDGALPYLPPELAHDPRVVSPATDLFMLGGLLYFLLAGVPPRLPPLSATDPRQYLATAVPIPVARRAVPGANEALARLVIRCLTPEPARRYGSAREVRKALESAL